MRRQLALPCAIVLAMPLAVHYRWRSKKRRKVRMAHRRPNSMGPARKIRFLQRSIIDEAGQRWDLSPGWLGPDQVAAAMGGADRVLLHDESFRTVRDPSEAEMRQLAGQLNDEGGSGAVVASLYRSAGRSILLFTVVDRGPSS